MGLCVLSLSIVRMMVVKIFVLYLIIIINSEVWSICHYLGLGHETMVYAVCLPIFLWREIFFSHDQQGANQVYWMSCLFQQGPKTFRNSWISPGHPARCPRLTLDHYRHHRRVLAHRHQNLNHQHWSRVIFVDKSRISLYNFDGRAWVCCHVGERLVSKKHAGFAITTIRVISSADIADGSSSGACMPTCHDGGDDDQESGWGISLKVLSDI